MMGDPRMEFKSLGTEYILKASIYSRQFYCIENSLMARYKDIFVEEFKISKMVIHGVKSIEPDSAERYFFFMGKRIFFADSSFIKEISFINMVIEKFSMINKNHRKCLICQEEKK